MPFKGHTLESAIRDDETVFMDSEIFAKEYSQPHEQFIGIDLGQRLASRGRTFIVVASRLDKDKVIYGYWIEEITDKPHTPIFRYASQIYSSLSSKQLMFV